MSSIGLLPVVVSMIATAALFGACENEGPRAQPLQAANPTPPTEPTGSTGKAVMPRRFHTACPMVVDGTEVGVFDTDKGVALTFTTGEGDVGDLRTRVEHMARMYEMHHGRGRMKWHHMRGRGMGQGMGRGMGPGRGQSMGPGRGQGMGPGRGQGMGPGMGRRGRGLGPMPATKAEVTDIDDGARLELEPEDPAQLDALRKRARWHHERMNAGNCWMLQAQTTQQGEAQTGSED